MTNHTLALEQVDAKLRKAISDAGRRPLVITRHGQPAYILRDVLDDDLADELIAQNPDFLQSIRTARQQKNEGRVKPLNKVRAKDAPALQKRKKAKPSKRAAH